MKQTRNYQLASSSIAWKSVRADLISSSLRNSPGAQGRARRKGARRGEDGGPRAPGSPSLPFLALLAFFLALKGVLKGLKKTLKMSQKALKMCYKAIKRP